MVRILTLLFIIVATQSVAHAWVSPLDTLERRGHWGVVVGFDNYYISDVSVKGEEGWEDAFGNSDYLWGLSGGVFYNYVLGKKRLWFFEPGLKLYHYSHRANPGVTNGQFHGKINRTGLYVPLYIGSRGRFNAKGLFFKWHAGPVFDIGLVAKRHPYSDSKGEYSSSAYGKDGVLSRFDLMLNLGFGLEFRGIYLGYDVYLGRLNQYHGNSPLDLQFKKFLISGRLSYQF